MIGFPKFINIKMDHTAIGAKLKLYSVFASHSSKKKISRHLRNVPQMFNVFCLESLSNYAIIAKRYSFSINKYDKKRRAFYFFEILLVLKYFLQYSYLLNFNLRGMAIT